MQIVVGASARLPGAVDLAGMAVQAVSVAAVETCIALPSARLAFDIGRCPPWAIRASTVAFTHAHVDHLGGLAHHCATRALHKLPPPRYLVPAESVDAFMALLAAWRRLDGTEMACEVISVAPGDRVPLGKHRELAVFRAVHRIPAVGYALVAHRTRLSPAWAGRSNEALIAARAGGESVNEAYSAVELVFCGDTTIDVVRREPLVRAAERLVLECTFVGDDTDVARARRTGHVHLDELAAHASQLDGVKALLLTHFSQRYSPDRIVAAVREKLPPDLLARTTLLLDQAPASM